MTEKPQPKMHVMTERQWRNMNRKFTQMENYLNNLNEKVSQLPKQKKLWLRFDECIPPNSVCRDVLSMLNGISTYDGLIGRLSEYYGCEPMRMKVDPGDKVSDKAIATYYWGEKTAYSKDKTCSTNTVLHEFFHHMQNCKVVVVDKKEEENCADKYARIFEQRAGTFP